MSKKNVNVMLTAFRDGFQSVYGARVLTDDFLPAVEAAKNAGINHFEAGGGARFQSLYFYCNEDAFEMMDRFRQTAGADANLQTLARGTNVVGLESQPRDVIKLHAKLFKKHGITTIRNFDALNDVNNLIYSGKCINDEGLKHEISVTMMGLPPGAEGAHDSAYYIRVLKNILDADIPFSSVCFKDASGTSEPSKVYETISEARKLLGADMPIRFHSHETAGVCVLQYKAALEAGADGLDLSMAPVSGGTCQADILTIWHALRGTEYELGIDYKKMLEAEEVFKSCMKDYFTPLEAKAVEPLIPFSPMPGGALTANTQMLRDNKIMDKYPEIILAMSEVVERGGFGTSVTPVSQFYFQQAFNNVMFGKWKKIADGYGRMLLGYFGRTPVKPDEELIKIAEEQLGIPATTEIPVDLNDKDETKGIEAARKRLEEAGITDFSEENLFISAACKEKGIAYLKGEAKLGIRKGANESAETPAKKSKASSGDYVVTVNGNQYSVHVSEGKGSAAPAATASSGEGEPILAPMPGSIIRILVEEGDSVEKDQAVMVIEAMKMETEISAPKTGTISAVLAAQGDQVEAGQELALIS